MSKPGWINKKNKKGNQNPIPSKISGYTVTEKEIISTDDKFTMIHNRIIQSRMLKPGEKLLYLALKHFCFDTDIAYPTKELLGYLLGVDEKTIWRLTKGLADKMIIAKQTYASFNKKKCFYLLLPPSEWLIEKENVVMEEWDKKQNEFEMVDDEEQYQTPGESEKEFDIPF